MSQLLSSASFSNPITQTLGKKSKALLGEIPKSPHFGFPLVKSIKYFGLSLIKRILDFPSSKVLWLFTRQNYFGFSLVKTIKTHTVQLIILENRFFLISAQN